MNDQNTLYDILKKIKVVIKKLLNVKTLIAAQPQELFFF